MIHLKIHHLFHLNDLQIIPHLIIYLFLISFDNIAYNNNDLLSIIYLDEYRWIIIIVHFIILMNLLLLMMFVYFLHLEVYHDLFLFLIISLFVKVMLLLFYFYCLLDGLCLFCLQILNFIRIIFLWMMLAFLVCFYFLLAYLYLVLFSRLEQNVIAEYEKFYQNYLF